jgi:hypothetical protein
MVSFINNSLEILNILLFILSLLDMYLFYMCVLRHQYMFECHRCMSSGKPRGKNRGKLSPFHFRFMTSGSGNDISGDVISGDATSGGACARDHFRHPLIAPSQIRGGWCFYTTSTCIIYFCFSDSFKSLPGVY